MTALENLWYGNIRPVETYIEGNVEYKNLLRLVSRNRDTLENELNSNQLELLEKYTTAVNEMNSISETAAFKYGLALAVSLLTE